MTKQQELREGVLQIVSEYGFRILLTEGKSLPIDCANKILTYLASQGAALKSNKKLPEYVVGINATDDTAKFIAEEVQGDMERAGWTAWEPLIEEKL